MYNKDDNGYLHFLGVLWELDEFMDVKFLSYRN